MINLPLIQLSEGIDALRPAADLATDDLQAQSFAAMIGVPMAQTPSATAAFCAPPTRFAPIDIKIHGQMVESGAEPLPTHLPPIQPGINDTKQPAVSLPNVETAPPIKPLTIVRRADAIMIKFGAVRQAALVEAEPAYTEAISMTSGEISTPRLEKTVQAGADRDEGRRPVDQTGSVIIADKPEIVAVLIEIPAEGQLGFDAPPIFPTKRFVPETPSIHDVGIPAIEGNTTSDVSMMEPILFTAPAENELEIISHPQPVKENGFTETIEHGSTEAGFCADLDQRTTPDKKKQVAPFTTAGTDTNETVKPPFQPVKLPPIIHAPPSVPTRTVHNNISYDDRTETAKIDIRPAGKPFFDFAETPKNDKDSNIRDVTAVRTIESISAAAVKKAVEFVKPGAVASANIVDQIEPQLLEIAFRTPAPGRQILKMRLNPVELGAVEITLDKGAGGRLDAHFHTDNEGARTVLNQTISQLRSSLESNGWQVGKIDVSCGSPDTNSGGRQNQQQFYAGEFETIAATRAAADRTGDRNESERLVSLRA